MTIKDNGEPETGETCSLQGKFRAKGLARRDAIVAAARILFLEKGFEHTSLTEIVDRSKGSRRTLYEHFGSKEGLLRAIIEDTTARVWASLQFPSKDKAPTEADLFVVALSFFRSVIHPDTMALYRIMVAEGGRIPGIADFFFDRGPRLMRSYLTALFQLAQAQGDFKGGTPENLAQAFCGLIMGDFHLRAALGQSIVLSDAEAERHVQDTLALFLRGAHGDDRTTP